MALFMGIHDMGGEATDEAIEQSWSAYKEACVKLGCSPQHAHYNASLGRAYCITEADSADMVQKAHDDAQVAVSEVLEIKELG